jgi:hypothetical protein
MPRSVPATVKRPARYSMSATAGLQRVGRQFLGLVDRALATPTCTAEPPVNSEREPALPKPLAAVGVALHDADALERHAEHVHRQLRVAGGDALAHGLRGRADLDEAVGVT